MALTAYEKGVRYRARHPEQVRALRVRYRMLRPEMQIARTARYRARHPAIVKAWVRRSRVKITRSYVADLLRIPVAALSDEVYEAKCSILRVRRMLMGRETGPE